MPAGIVTNGVILRVLGGTMRKFKPRQPRGLPFRLLVILAGALLLLAAFAPCANAQAYSVFTILRVRPSPPYPVNLDSHPPALETGPAFAFDPRQLPLAAVRIPSPVPQPRSGLPVNVPPGAPPNLTSLGIHSSGRR